jgi:hypothetical protein
MTADLPLTCPPGVALHERLGTGLALLNGQDVSAEPLDRLPVPGYAGLAIPGDQSHRGVLARSLYFNPAGNTVEEVRPIRNEALKLLHQS